MKKVLSGILLIFTSLCAFAQETSSATDSLQTIAPKNNTFVDLGLSFGTGLPGLSVTYNRKLTRHFGLGIGAQGYFYSGINEHYEHIDKLIPAVYADLRWYWHVRYGQLFLLEDIGIDLYHGYEASDHNRITEHTDGVYEGIGFGYTRRLNKLGISPYLSLKIVSDAYTTTDTYLGHTSEMLSLDATFVLSIGLRF